MHFPALPYLHTQITNNSILLGRAIRNNMSRVHAVLQCDCLCMVEYIIMGIERDISISGHVPVALYSLERESQLDKIKLLCSVLSTIIESKAQKESKLAREAS